VNLYTRPMHDKRPIAEAAALFDAQGEQHPTVVVSPATFEALLEAGLLECRFGKFLYKGVGPVVQTEPA